MDASILIAVHSGVKCDGWRPGRVSGVHPPVDTGGSPAGPVAKQSAVQIGAQIEKLAEALDRRDCQQLVSLAERLQHVARRQGVEDIAEAAQQLKSAADESDLVEAVRLTIDLLELCRSIQDVLLVVDDQEAAVNG